MTQTALVTGGARGLGAAICKELREAGYEVIAADVNAREPSIVKLDITREEEVVRAFAKLERLDVLVNNAGVDYTLPIDELSMNQWDTVMAGNLGAPFLLAKLAPRLMKRQGRGHTFNFCSTQRSARGRTL